MYSNKKMLLTGSSTTCIVIALLASNTITNLCFAQPLDANTTIVENSKHLELKENAKPHSPTKDESSSKLDSPLTNIIELHPKPALSSAEQTQETSHDSEADFPDRRGFFTGHRIPLELFPEETLRNIELIGETTPKTVPTAKSTNALKRVAPGHPRRIPLELFSEESLRRIDGLDVEEDELFEANFPRRVPLELFSDDSLKRLDLLEEKKEQTTSKPSTILPKLRSYVDSDDIRESDEDTEELKRTPRFAIRGGISDDPEAAAHHFPALTIGGEGDPAFLDTLLSYYN